MLDIRDLSLSYREPAGPARGIERISLALPAGACLGVTGPSGSGKSTLAAALAGMLPANAVVTGGSLRLDNIDLLRLGIEARVRLRERRIAWIPQEPMRALEPLSSVGAAVDETLAAAGHVGDRKGRAVEILAGLGIEEPKRLLTLPCHRLDPSLAQRVLVAIALAQLAALIILDEPMLEPTEREPFLLRLKALSQPWGAAIIVLSREPSVAATASDRLAVLHDGRIMEQGPTAAMIVTPRHPCSRDIMALAGPWRFGGPPPAPVPPARPSPAPALAGCRYADRCALVEPACHAGEPPMFSVGEGQMAACILARPGRAL